MNPPAYNKAPANGPCATQPSTSTDVTLPDDRRVVSTHRPDGCVRLYYVPRPAPIYGSTDQ